MAEDKKTKKKTLNKIFVSVSIIFVMILTVTGIIAIVQSKGNGADSVLTSESELNNIIHNVSSQTSLTDDQFYLALQKIFPHDTTAEQSKRKTVSKITQILADAGITADVYYFNNFGSPGYLVVTQSSIQNVLPYLDYSLCSAYQIQVLDDDAAGMIGSYMATAQGYTTRFELGMPIGDQETLDSLADLCRGLKDQYEIEKIVATTEALCIYSYELTTSDLLDAFDYTYQWCLENAYDRQIFLYSSDIVVATSNPSLADDFYTSNYPIDDLAAMFRLEYYSANCFFTRFIQNLCDLYL